MLTCKKEEKNVCCSCQTYCNNKRRLKNWTIHKGIKNNAHERDEKISSRYKRVCHGPRKGKKKKKVAKENCRHLFCIFP